MPDSGFLALFLVGLLGGTHCVGMCGGSSAPSRSVRRPLVVLFSYNAGRILSRCGGAIAGALGAASLASKDRCGPLDLLFLANLMLVALGLYLLG